MDKHRKILVNENMVNRILGEERCQLKKIPHPRVKENEHKHKLYWALRTRVLSAKEMDEVETYGSSLVSEWDIKIYWSGQQPDNSDKRAIIFNDALLQQMKLRKLAGENLEIK